MTILHNVDGVRFSGHTTEERDAISEVAREHLLILNTDTGQFEFYIDGQGWRGILRLEPDGTITPIHHGEFVDGDLHVEYARTAAPEEITTAWLLKSGGIIKPLAGDPPEGAIAIQRKTSTGAPTHSAELAVLCWVQPDDDIYINNDGDVGWTKQAKDSSLHDADEIIDTDGDTHWRAETSPDEDILRAVIAGTEHFRVGGTSQLDFFNGSILETTRLVVMSNGTTVTLSLDQAGGGDLTLIFSDGFSIFDTTPAITVTLTPGSDTSPQTNYVYILQSNKTLTVSTSGWPSEEHAPISIVILQSAATTQTENALVVHLWHDHVQGSDEQGHYSHIGRWIRQHSATYESGVAQTFTITTNAGVPDNLDFATTAGEVYQMHLHAVPAFDTATGTNVHVVNDSVSPYTPVTDLADLLTDSAGGSMSGKYFNLVIWASVSEEMDETHLFINLPSGSYNKLGDAIDDVSGFTDFTIPDDFKGTAFLISRLTLRHQAASGGTWTSEQETDLRGLIPNLVAGGGTSAITTEFADNAFRLFDESNVTKLLAFQLSGITPGNTRTITMPDEDVTLKGDIFTTHIAEFPALAEDLATGVMGGRPGKCVGESGEHGPFSALRAKAVAGTAGTGTTTILVEADDNPAFSSPTVLFTLALNTSTEVDDTTLDNTWAAGDIWVRARCTAVGGTAPKNVNVFFYFKERAEAF
jgi:hypothetical protein